MPKGVAVTHRSAAAFVDAEARVFLTDEPIGTNRTMLSIYSPLAFDEVAVDGEVDEGRTQQELGLNVYTIFANVPPGGSVTVTAQLSGLPLVSYHRPQATLVLGRIGGRPKHAQFDARPLL